MKLAVQVALAGAASLLAFFATETAWARFVTMSDVAATAPDIVQSVQGYRYNRRRFIDEDAQERWIQRRLARTPVHEEDDYIYLPGIENDRRGRTIMRGPPRVWQQPQRLGVPHGRMQPRITTPWGWGDGGRRPRLGERQPFGPHGGGSVNRNRRSGGGNHNWR